VAPVSLQGPLHLIRDKAMPRSCLSVVGGRRSVTDTDTAGGWLDQDGLDKKSVRVSGWRRIEGRGEQWRREAVLQRTEGGGIKQGGNLHSSCDWHGTRAESHVSSLHYIYTQQTTDATQSAWPWLIGVIAANCSPWSRIRVIPTRRPRPLMEPTV
jgi:hypothetical protein